MVAAFVKLSDDRQAECMPFKFPETTVVYESTVSTLVPVRGRQPGMLGLLAPAGGSVPSGFLCMQGNSPPDRSFKLKVCDNPVCHKYIQAVFIPAYFVTLGHVLLILTEIQTSSLLSYVVLGCHEPYSYRSTQISKHLCSDCLFPVSSSPPAFPVPET